MKMLTLILLRPSGGRDAAEELVHAEAAGHFTSLQRRGGTEHQTGSGGGIRRRAPSEAHTSSPQHHHQGNPCICWCFPKINDFQRFITTVHFAKVMSCTDLPGFCACASGTLNRCHCDGEKTVHRGHLIGELTFWLKFVLTELQAFYNVILCCSCWHWHR